MFKYLNDMIFVVIFLASTSCVSASRCLTEITYQTRIVNGFEVPSGKFPSVVAIYKYDTRYCGGTILTRKFVVTAAHCVDESGTYYVVAGTTNLDRVEYRMKVKNITLHPGYHVDFSGIKNDIALVKLDISLPLITRRIWPAKLPRFSTEIPREYGTVLGWGDKGNDTTEQVQDLMAVELIKQECNVDEHFFCAGHPDGNKDSCDGDSGGPFLIKGTLFGIVSYGLSPYCAAGFPGVYVKVPYFVNWIRETAGMLNCTFCF